MSKDPRPGERQLQEYLEKARALKDKLKALEEEIDEHLKNHPLKDEKEKPQQSD